MSADRGYRFTDPFTERGSTVYGRPGIRDEFAVKLNEDLLSLNAIHEAYLAPEGDMSAVVAALRAATSEQVEAARHLMIHALDRLDNAIFSRRHSLSHLSKHVAEDRAYASCFPLAEEGSEEREEDRVQDATSGPALLKAVFDEVDRVSKVAFERARRNPTNLRRAAAVGELSMALAQASLVLGTAAEDEPTLASAAGRARVASAAFSAKVDALRAGLGAEYAEAATVMGTGREASEAAMVGAVGIVDVRASPHESRERLVADLGGSAEGNLARWPFRRRSSMHSGDEAYLYPMPSDLTPSRAEDYKNRVADAIEAYQSACHSSGFVGYVRQAIFAVASSHRPPLALHCAAKEAGEILTRARARLLGDPAPTRAGNVTFRTALSRPGEDDDFEEGQTVLVGTFDDADDGDQFFVVYPKDTTTTVEGAAYLCAMPRAMIEEGIPCVERARDCMFVGSNFASASSAMDGLPEASVQCRMARVVSSVSYSSEPHVLEPEPAMVP